MIALLDFFQEALYRAPTIGSMLMGAATAVVGVILLLRKETLLGEALSHSAYPGVMLSALASSFLLPSPGRDRGLLVLLGAAVTAFLGLKAIQWVQRRLNLVSDAALCLILSTFFGAGVLIASRLQITHASWYRNAHIYLFGQAATLCDSHIVIYAVLVAVTLLTVFFLYRYVQWITFDQPFVQSLGVKVAWVHRLVDVLMLLSVLIGMRSVGVVLLSGMLVAPAVAARAWTHTLSRLFMIAALIGALSGFLGNALSVWIPGWLKAEHMALPTGPMIVLVAFSITLLSLCFVPQSGLVARWVSQHAFSRRCALENALKRVWKEGPGHLFSLRELLSKDGLFAALMLWRQGWIRRRVKGSWELSSEGSVRAKRIVRLHRLWEVYLVDYLGQNKERVHAMAEHIEHILTPDLERELTLLLKNPLLDPHQQPIPEDDESILGK